jgi:protoheme IX farnesyltransferase
MKKIKDYLQLIKFRLTLLVVFSASMAYLWATHRKVNTQAIWLLSIGEFLIMACSNIFNQIIERKSDKLMSRTASRHLHAGRMAVKEALVAALLTGGIGLFILWKVNYSCCLLGFTAMFIYVVIYTPLKKISSLAVVPGAIAGSLPVVLLGQWLTRKKCPKMRFCFLLSNLFGNFRTHGQLHGC